MARKDYLYSALAAGTSLLNGSTTQAIALGASNIVVSNGTLVLSSDAPAGMSGSLEGVTQSTSGTSYLYETITSTTVLSMSVWWKMPTAAGTIGASMVFVGNGGTRQFVMTRTNTNQIKFFNSANGNLFTTTFSGGATFGQWYRTDFYAQQNASPTTANGTFVTSTYLDGSNTPLTGGDFSSTTSDVGILGYTQIRQGSRTATGTADENSRIRVAYDPSAAYLMGQFVYATQTLTATQAAAVVLGKAAAAAQTLTSTQAAAMVVTKNLAASQTLTVTQAAALAVSGGTSANQTLTATQAAALVLGKVGAATQTLTATQSASLTLGSAAPRLRVAGIDLSGSTATTPRLRVGGVTLSGTVAINPRLRLAAINLSGTVTVNILPFTPRTMEPGIPLTVTAALANGSPPPDTYVWSQLSGPTTPFTASGPSITFVTPAGLDTNRVPMQTTVEFLVHGVLDGVASPDTVLEITTLPGTKFWLNNTTGEWSVASRLPAQP